MKMLKILIPVSAAIGLLAIFLLPYVNDGDFHLKYWDVRDMGQDISQGLFNGPKQVYVALVAFLSPLLIGVLAIATKRLARWHGVVALLASWVALVCEGVRRGLLGGDGLTTAIGGKLLFLAAIAGMISAIAAIAKPVRAST